MRIEARNITRIGLITLLLLGGLEGQTRLGREKTRLQELDVERAVHIRISPGDRQLTTAAQKIVVGPSNSRIQLRLGVVTWIEPGPRVSPGGTSCSVSASLNEAFKHLPTHGDTWRRRCR